MDTTEVTYHACIKPTDHFSAPCCCLPSKRPLPPRTCPIASRSLLLLPIQSLLHPAERGALSRPAVTSSPAGLSPQQRSPGPNGPQASHTWGHHICDLAAPFPLLTPWDPRPPSGPKVCALLSQSLPHSAFRSLLKCYLSGPTPAFFRPAAALVFLVHALTFSPTAPII